MCETNKNTNSLNFLLTEFSYIVKKLRRFLVVKKIEQYSKMSSQLFNEMSDVNETRKL